MNYTLLGSLTSPFVRRIRMVMENIPYDLKELNIFETDDALTLNKYNPVNQLPVLINEEIKILDSRHIFNYLNKIYKLQEFSWEEENQLTIIEGALNSGINLLLMKRSGMKIDEPYMFINRQKERLDSVLDYLRPYIEGPALKDWNFITMTLYSFLDWGVYRGILNLDLRPECHNFLEHYKNKAIVQQTAIPKV